jgi:hypothetical protein
MGSTQEQLESLGDWVDGFIGSLHRVGNTASMDIKAVMTEVQKNRVEVNRQIKSWSGRFERNNKIINKKFVHFDEELEKVVGLVGERIDAKMGEISGDFLEVMEIEEARWSSSEVKIAALEEKIKVLQGLVALQNGSVISLRVCVEEIEDVMIEDSDVDAEGDTALSTSSSDIDLVENMVVIPIPVPSTIHGALIPIEVPEGFIPPSLCSTPSPPYVQAWEDDPLHNGVPEYWVDPSV